MACLFPTDWSGLTEKLASPEIIDWATNLSGTFAMISTAEIGDKSQLVCMTLAARYRGVPIVLGAATAFALLNLAGVVFGATLAQWIPHFWVEMTVIVLFTLFGIRALLTGEEDDDVEDSSKTSNSVFITTFLMIFAAEFGDKTQLAVAALGATIPPVPVWSGATLALTITSALGVWAGRALLQRIPLHWLHRLSGVMFLGFAAYTAWPLIPIDDLLSLIPRLT